jgi:hypothetical protein
LTSQLGTASAHKFLAHREESVDWYPAMQMKTMSNRMQWQCFFLKREKPRLQGNRIKGIPFKSEEEEATTH